VINDFVRIQSHGSNQTIEQGYNTDARPLQFDENKSPTFTRSLQLNELPTTTVNGVVYRELLLGVNQNSSQPYLSLDALQLFVSTSPTLTGYSGGMLGNQSPIYDMGTNNWVKLDARLTHGNGSGDMFLLVPDQSFTSGGAGTNPYVYVYSKFGMNCPSNGGFEQWAPGVINQATGMISGQVLCTDGSPEAGVKVFLANSSAGTFDGDELYTITDGSGYYAFNDLSLGNGSLAATYYVTAVPPPDASTQSNIVNTVYLNFVTTTAVVNFTVDCSTPAN
jgi:hypothetical protein